ncbi:DNA-binding transcriptional regulator, LysR family [Rhizobium sp. NFR07]|uniref:LysR family transcriptional regulator n=1 Tax=Rhizobium sp. NFR07 TaxID=1566262 RepID=UPI0008E4BE33|nr:LysR family transcriptional regulator [Rhizobium sp. NFR07]SFB18775.1 DNA-binding transcriptional regulator, LysR family [Rhizobium sp. NFR07]
MRFDLTDLRLFLAVADAGSITRGAADVGLSLAAASDRLREMEATGEVRLLKRGRRGVTMTEAGETLSHHARKVLDQVALMHGELGEHAKGLRTTIRVLANTAAVVEMLPVRLSPWMAAHPQVDIELRERQSHEIARSVAAGFADIGVLSDALAHEGLILEPFALSRLVVVSDATHWLSVEKEIRLSGLTDQHFVGLAGGALQDHIDAQAERIGAKLRYRIKLRSFDAICTAAGEGVGIAIVPETIARRHRRASRLSITRLTDPWATRHLSVCAISGTELAPLKQSLFDHLAGR